MSDGMSGLLAVCFTDLAGSTELMGSVGERAWDRLRTDHFTALREALLAHGGREVKNTGDGILVVFGSAAEAIDAAVAMQQSVDVHARRAGLPLAMRVGIALGDVTRDADDVFGTPVVEAARLVAAARPGQILCTAVVRTVAGTRTSAPFASVGTIELKGLPVPVDAFEVLWEPAEGATWPLPPLLTGAGRVFVGRAEELNVLGQAWKEAAAGEGRLVLLGGEPGIGKTRLAAELARRLADEGAVVLAGRCDEDLGVPYQPFVEALRHYLAHTTGNGHFGRHTGELIRLVPELGDRIPDLPPPLHSDAETERYRLFDAVAAWLADASGEAPVLLVLDDLHWAAKPTVLLLRHVLHSAEPRRLLMVATYRDTDIGRGHPLSGLLADVHRIPGALRLPVRGLDGPEVAAFLQAAAGHDLDEDSEALARLVWRETEGNAFFVAEVLRNLIEAGAVEQRDGRWAVTAPGNRIPVPESVRDAIGRRLSRLPEEANRVLACAAVVGLEFEPAVVEAAGGFPEDAVISALEQAVSARLVVDVPGVAPRNRFTHALVRDTLYDELTAARRTALHRHVAEALEVLHRDGLDDHLPALAYHWARASAPAAHTERAVDYAVRAGDRALAQLAHDEAVGYYRSALELLDTSDGPPDEERRLQVLLSLGGAERRAGEPAHRETLLQAARLAEERGDADSLARAALANSRGTWAATGGVDRERVAALRAALAAVPEAALSTRAQLLGNLGAETTFADDEDANRRILDEALTLARQAGDAATLVGVLRVRFRSLSGPQAPAERAMETSEMLAAAHTLGDPVAICWALLLRGRSALESGARDDADRCFTQAQQVAQETGQPTLLAFDALYRGALAEAAGRADEAERLRRTFLELGTATAMPEATGAYGMLLMLQRLGDGDPLEAEPFLRQGMADLPGLDFTGALLGWLAAETGRLDEARAALATAQARSFASFPRTQFYVAALVGWSATAAGVSDARAARLLEELLRPFPEHIVNPANLILGSLAHARGLLAATTGDLDDALTHFAVAEGQHKRFRFPAWLTRTRFETARTLLRRNAPGDADRAEALLRKCLATSAEFGLTRLRRQVEAVLAAAD